MTEIKSAKLLATYEHHSTAERAIRELSEAGFDMRQITVMGLDYHTEERPVDFVNTGDRVLTWGALGAFWGSVWGMLLGSAVLFVPGVGHVIGGGWLASTLAGLVEGAMLGGGAGVVSGALASIGIPRDSVIEFEADVQAGKFVLAVRGTDEEVERARLLLADTHPERVVRNGMEMPLRTRA